MFKGINLGSLNDDFKTDESCKQYLYDLKWKSGFRCRRCAHNKSWKGKTDFHRRCTLCGYDESVTANTAFHKIKIPLKKAFGLAFQMSVPKKGKSSNELRKEFKINSKTALAFRRKVHSVMQEDHCVEVNRASEEVIVLDSVAVTNRGNDLNGFQRIWLQLYKKEGANKRFEVKGRCSLLNDNAIDFSHLIGGKFKDPGARILIWSFKIWLTGIHHHCSISNINGYLAEFLFRHSFRDQVERIWHILIERLIANTNRFIVNTT